MFAGLRDGFGDRKMRAGCCENQDEIDIRPREKVVLRVENWNFPFLSEGATSFGRGRETADDLRAARSLQLAQGCHVRFSCHAQIDDSDAYRHSALLVATYDFFCGYSRARWASSLDSQRRSRDAAFTNK
jgi:hypothetical protein